MTELETKRAPFLQNDMARPCVFPYGTYVVYNHGIPSAVSVSPCHFVETGHALSLQNDMAIP